MLEMIYILLIQERDYQLEKLKYILIFILVLKIMISVKFFRNDYSKYGLEIIGNYGFYQDGDKYGLNLKDEGNNRENLCMLLLEEL